MELQIRISGFEMPVKGGETTNASLKLTNTRLEIGSTNIPPNNHSHSLSPNPHTHELNPNPHSHSLSAGIQTFLQQPPNSDWKSVEWISQMQ